MTEHKDYLLIGDDIRLHPKQFNLSYAGQSRGWSVYHHRQLSRAKNYVATLFPGVFAVVTDYKNLANYSSLTKEGVYLPMLSISYAFEGRMEWNMASDNRHAYSPPENLLLYSYARHESYCDFPDGGFTCLELNFCLPLPEKTVSLLRDFGLEWSAICDRYLAEEIMIIRNKGELTRLFSPFHPRSLSDPQAFRLLCLNILKFLQDYDGSLLQPLAYLPNERVDRLMKLAESFRDNLKESERQEDMAARLGISKTYLQQQFKLVFGCSIHAYIKRLRLERAAALLLEKPPLTVGKIAESVGYKHPGKFSVAFKGMYGCSPLTYRQKGGQIQPIA